MGRTSNPYTQLGIGVCGHVIGTWPQISDGGGMLVVCEECTRQKFALDGDETFLWVHLAPEKAVGVQKTTTPPKRESKPKKEKPLTPWQSLLREEGLF